MKDLKALLGKFRGWPIVGFFIERIEGLSAEDRERHLLGDCKLALGHYVEFRLGTGSWLMTIWMVSGGGT